LDVLAESAKKPKPSVMRTDQVNQAMRIDMEGIDVLHLIRAFTQSRRVFPPSSLCRLR
jgi:hypothetical protein